MAESSGMFNSVDNDRLYNASWFAEYFSNFLTNGVYNGGTELQVHVHGSDYIVRVSPGRAWIQGYYYSNADSDVQLNPTAADATQDRIDRVVLRCNLNAAYRSIAAYIKEGTLGSGLPPTLTQDLDGAGIYEISLAQISIAHGTTVLTGAMITDERLDGDVCGLVESLIQADTTSIFNQFQDYYDLTTAAFDAALAGYTSDIEDIIDDWTAWFAAQKVNIFDAVYFYFENYRYRDGCYYRTRFDYPASGDITEGIYLTADDSVIATKTTEFDTPSTGNITETLYVAADAYTVKKVTVFDSPSAGYITETISEVV